MIQGRYFYQQETNKSQHLEYIYLFRLTFYNLKADTGLNVLSPGEKQEIWVPRLLFSNTENNLGYEHYISYTLII